MEIPKETLIEMHETIETVTIEGYVDEHHIRSLSKVLRTIEDILTGRRYDTGSPGTPPDVSSDR